MNKSKSFTLFNRAENFPKAAEELKIEITFVDENGMQLLGLLNNGKTFGTVVGYLNKEFEYTAVGNYTNIFNVNKPDSLFLKLIEDESQRNLGNYGYLTKKMYTNGESPSIDVSFRCYSGDSEKSAKYKTNSPIEVANALVNATLPRVGNNNILNFTSLSNLPDSNNPIGKLFNTVATTLKTSYSGYDASLKYIRGEREEAVNEADKASNNFSESFVDLWSSIKDLELSDIVSKKPPVCNVKIGNFFEKEMMVVKQVSFKLSKEFISPGEPLYADFDITLQSLFNSSTLESGTDKKTEKIFGSGLNKTGSSRRVSFDEDKKK